MGTNVLSIFSINISVRLGLVCAATVTSWKCGHSKSSYCIFFQKATKEGADQTARMCRLVCAILVSVNCVHVAKSSFCDKTHNSYLHVGFKVSHSWLSPVK